MMANDLPSLLSLLRENSIRVRVDDGKLKLTGPPEALTPELRQMVRERKSELVHCLSAAEAPVFFSQEHRAEPRLSIGQEDLWRRHCQSPLKYFYHVPRALRILGPLDVDRLKRALQSLIQQHDILRTNVVSGRDGPRAVVREHVDFHVVVHDLRGSRDAEQEAAWMMEAEIRLPFDLETDCLIRALLLKISHGNSILLVTAHHLVADCWSLGFAYQSLQSAEELWHPGLFFESMFALYRDGSKATPELNSPVSFFDAAAWQRELVISSQGRKQLAYWHETWNPLPAHRLFPTHSPDEAPSGRRVAFVLPAHLPESIRRVAGQQGTTPHAWMLTAFMIVLHHWKACPDIVVGMPVAGRRAAELQSVIGSIGNNVIVRARFTPESSFLDMVRGVQRSVIDAIDHQEYPIEILQEKFDAEHTLPEVRFIMQTPRSSRSVTPELEVVPLPLSRGTSKYPLSVTVVEQPGGYRGWAEFLDSCLDKKTLAKLIDALAACLAVSLEDPTARISGFFKLGSHQHDRF